MKYCLSVFLFGCSINLLAQITIINSPPGYEGAAMGYYMKEIEFMGNIYFSYTDNNVNRDLLKYDGVGFTIIPSPVGFDNGLCGYDGAPFIFGSNLYLRYKANDGKIYLGKYDGTNLTIYNGSNDPVNYLGYPIVFQNALYFCANEQLYKYDGTSFVAITSAYKYVGYPFIFNNELFLQYYNGSIAKKLLGKYDGANLSFIASPGNSNYMWPQGEYKGNYYLMFTENSSYQFIKLSGSILTKVTLPNNDKLQGLFLFKNKWVLRLQNSSLNNYLCFFDGVNFLSVPSPLGYNGASTFSNQFGFISLLNSNATDSTFYLSYAGNDGNVDIAKYDSSGLTIFPCPPGYELSYGIDYNQRCSINPTIISLKIADNNGNKDLAVFDGNNFTIIPSPLGYDSLNSGYERDAIVYNSELYIQYRSNAGALHLAKYDGTSLSIVNMPSTHITYRGNPFIANNTLYFSCTAIGGNHDLAKIYNGGSSITTNANSNNFLIYPNPTASNITIDIEQPSLIVVLNILGEVKYSRELKSKETIDVSQFSNGVYIIKDLTSGKALRFIKQ